jgi:hypothetical protein
LSRDAIIRPPRPESIVIARAERLAFTFVEISVGRVMEDVMAYDQSEPRIRRGNADEGAGKNGAAKIGTGEEYETPIGPGDLEIEFEWESPEPGGEA